jgi:hypothetical protein
MYVHALRWRGFGLEPGRNSRGNSDRRAVAGTGFGDVSGIGPPGTVSGAVPQELEVVGHI